MRQLFVPACVCLMTWSGATGSDPRLSLDEFFGTAKANSKIHAQHAPIDNAESNVEVGSAEPARAEIPVNMSAAEIARETPTAEKTAAETNTAETAVAENTAAEAPPAEGAPAETIVEKTPDAPAQAAERVPLPPVAKPVVHRTREEVCETLTRAAESNHLPVPFFISLLFQESRFQPEAVSAAGAQGVAQFMPATAASMGLKNPFDPLQAIPASARLLRELVSQFGNVGLAAAAYNAGPKRIQDWLQKKTKLPEETKGYVKTITGRPAENWTAASLLPGQRLPRHAPCQEAAGLYAANGPATIPLPPPSPQRLAEMAPTLVAKNEDRKTPSKHRIASIEKNAKAKTADAGQSDAGKSDAGKSDAGKPVVVASADGSVPAASSSSIKIAKHGARVTAVINVGKLAAKTDAKTDAKADTKSAAKPAAKTTKTASKTASKPLTQQLAARKQHKPKFDRMAQR